MSFVLISVEIRIIMILIMWLLMIVAMVMLFVMVSMSSSFMVACQVWLQIERIVMHWLWFHMMRFSVNTSLHV